MKRPTQKDVATLSGVSQAAVSVVLRDGDSSKVSAQTLVRIKDAVRQLGYIPNRAAQTLKTNRTMTVACMVPDIANPFYPALLRGIQQVMEGDGYDVIAVNTDGLAARELHFIDWLRQRRVDGVIGVFWSTCEQDFKPLVDEGMPIVRVESASREASSLAIDDIFIDGRAAAYQVTRYLINRGHRSIGMIAGHAGPDFVRVEGYRQALEEASLTPFLAIEEHFSEEGGFRAAMALLESGTTPSAIFAANDLMAIGALQAVRERGLDVPRDIAVVGFDDIPASRLVTPQLTTVAQNQDLIGKRAAEILLERLSGARSGPGTICEMPFQLIERASS